jgi:type I restriction enzyme S subunit
MVAINKLETERYKSTEVGVLPADWFCLESAVLVGYFGGNSFKGSDGTSRGTRWLKIANVGIRRANWKEISYLPSMYLEQFGEFRLVDGDVVIALTRPILGGELKIARLGRKDVPALLNQRVAKIVAKQGADLSYIFYVLQTSRFINSMNEAMAGTDPPNIGVKTLGKISIPVPPSVEEQKNIADALSDTDALIFSLERLIEKKRNIKQGAMQGLLTGKIRLPGFNQQWTQYTVGDVMDFSGGSQPPRSTFKFDEVNDFIRLVQIRDYKTDEYKTYIPRHLAKKLCDDEDVMIGRYGPPIFQILRGIAGAYNVALIKVIPRPNLRRSYLYYFLKQNSLFQFIENLSQRSSGQTGVDLVALRAYAFPLPPLNEQDAISEVLSNIDEDLIQLESKCEKLRMIKQGMMQVLLTGKIRLV